MAITFEKIHEVVVEALDISKNYSYKLSVVGNWYYNFLESDSSNLLIHVPEYSDEFVNLACDYIRLFSLTYRLAMKPKLIEFNDTCLFNIFNYNSRLNRFPENSRSTYDFIKEEGDILIWSSGEDDVLVSRDRFMPVFLKVQVERTSNWKNIYNTFKLFKFIENKGLINYPILINFEEDLCVFLSSSNLNISHNYLSFKTILWNNREMDDQVAANLEEELRENDVLHQITIKYPYHKNIHTWLSGIGKKSFELIFNSRFCYQELSEDSVYLLPNELKDNVSSFIGSKPSIIVTDTNHNTDLFELLNNFRQYWQEYRFNKFTTPFPKYWFLFINQSISQEEWFEMFKADYPDVATKPLIDSIKKIIELLYLFQHLLLIDQWKT